MNDKSVRQKKIPLLLAHYRAVFANADYVYLTADAAMWERENLLFELSISSSIMNDTPLVMVKPGVEQLQQLSTEKDKENQGERKDSALFDNPYTARGLSELFRKLETPNIRMAAGASLHVMLSADSVWDGRGNLVRQEEEPWSGVSEERALQLAVLRKHRECTQIVISQSSQLLLSLRELCKTGIKGAPNADGLITLSINDEGYLYDPFETNEKEALLLSRVSRKKLNALVRQQPVYIDDSALRHPQAKEMLQNIKPGLIQAEKPLIVLTGKEEPLSLSEILVARAQETPPTARFVWLNDTAGKTEAITQALLTDTASLSVPSKISFITDRVSRAEKIQQQLAGLGILVEIYSVNKHGFLSNRDKTKPGLGAGKPSALEQARNKQLIEQAVKSGDMQTALELIGDKEVLKNGVITCLCEKRADMLEQLLKHADRVQSSLITWWIQEYKQFSAPSFLLDNPKFYDLLVLALSKCAFFANQAEKWQERLQELAESPTAAKVELSFLISLLDSAHMRAGVTGATRLRRADIPKILPRSDLSSVEVLRGRLQVLEAKRNSLLKEIEKLTAECKETELQIHQLSLELPAATAH